MNKRARTADRRALLQDAFLAVIVAHDRLQRRAVGFMRRYDLTQSQYNVLRILRGAGPEGKPSQRIADDMISKVPDVTRLVDRLVEAGYAGRERDRDDGRIVRVVITAAGLDLLARIDEPIHDLHDGALGDLTDHELKALAKAARKVREPDVPA